VSQPAAVAALIEKAVTGVSANLSTALSSAR
jgi:hypothetical protein